MSTRSLAIVLAMLVLPAHATSLGQTTLGKLVSGAHVVVVGKVARVVEVPAGEGTESTVRVAEVEVLEWIKGKPRPKRLWYLAEGTDSADVSTALSGERALLFLSDPLVPRRPSDEGVATRLESPVFRKHLEEMTGGLPLLHICWSGCGRLPLGTVEGVEYATLSTFLVRTPPDMTTIPPADPVLTDIERGVPLDALKSFMKERLVPCRGPAPILRLLDELDATTNPWPSEKAQSLIESLGPAAIPALLALLDDPAFPRRDTVAEALFWIGDPAWEALREALGSKEVARRRGAAFALAWAANTEFVDREEVTPEAVTAANDPDPDEEFRARMIAALARGGGTDETEPVVAAIAALRDESLRVRRSAARTLLHLASWHGDSLPEEAEAALLPLAGHEDVDFRREVWEALAWAAGPKALPAARAALEDADRVVRVLAVFTLRRIRAPEATQHLIRALGSDDAWLRRYAAYGLGVQRAAEAVGPLAQALADPDEGVVDSARDALGEIGPAAAAAVPVLEKLLATTDDPYLRAGIEAALAKIRE